MAQFPTWLDETTELQVDTAEQLRQRWGEAYTEVERLVRAVERLIETPARGTASRAAFYRSLEPLEAALARAEAELLLIERLIEDAEDREKLSVN